jgi:ABC-type nitrate/sulfonate/bicarbonate transport system ATPase subunit
MIETPPQASRAPGADRAMHSEHAAAPVDLDRVSRTFQRGRQPAVPALAGVSLQAAEGQIVTVVGPSGCGKSTLLELICGLQRPDAGVVRCAPAALMPQRDLLLPWASALDNAALALRAGGVGRQAARELARPWLERFGLAEFERTRPAQLSGGMRQRVSFLRSLLAGKPVLALDEPFASLDAITRAEMQGWLDHALIAEPRTVVLVTHDVEEAVLLGDRVVVLSGRPGRVVASIEVALPRPRRRADPAVVALRERVLSALGVSG